MTVQARISLERLETFRDEYQACNRLLDQLREYVSTLGHVYDSYDAFAANLTLADLLSFLCYEDGCLRAAAGREPRDNEARFLDQTIHDAGVLLGDLVAATGLNGDSVTAKGLIDYGRHRLEATGDVAVLTTQVHS